MTLKLGRRAKAHFMTLIEIGVHLIRVNPGHICGDADDNDDNNDDDDNRDTVDDGSGRTGNNTY